MLKSSKILSSSLRKATQRTFSYFKLPNRKTVETFHGYLIEDENSHMERDDFDPRPILKKEGTLLSKLTSLVLEDFGELHEEALGKHSGRKDTRLTAFPQKIRDYFYYFK